MIIVETILVVVTLYVLIGVVFAALFVTVGVSRLDSAAKGGPIGFRIFIFPGSAALWPVMLIKWRHARKARGA